MLLHISRYVVLQSTCHALGHVIARTDFISSQSTLAAAAADFCSILEMRHGNFQVHASFHHDRRLVMVCCGDVLVLMVRIIMIDARLSTSLVKVQMYL